MKKKLLPISLLCLFGMLLAGCGGNKKSSSQVPSSSVEPATSSVVPSSEVAPASSSDSSPASTSEQPAAVSGVSLDKETASVILDQTLQLTATVAPENAGNKAVRWSSEDEDIVTVNQEGLVTAVSVGTAKIFVRTAEGNFSAQCEVSVIKEITKVEITNKEAEAFKAFTVDDMESINVSVDPADNVTALLAAGALKVTSSDESVATVSGLTLTGIKAGKTTITVELFGKSDSFELTVGEAIPGIPHTIAEAFDIAKTEAVCTGSSGGTTIAITETCFKFETAKVLAVARNYSSSSKTYSDTAFVALIDDGTEAVYLQVSKTKEEAIPVQPGDYVEVTCKLSNYYGLFEGVSRKAEEGVRAPYIPLKDFNKIDAPETPITPHLNEAEAMDAAGFSAYYATCKANGAKDAADFNVVKYVELDVTYDENRAENTDNGGYVVGYDNTEKKDLALQHIGENELDEPFDGQKSKVKAYLIGCNTGKAKSNCFVLEQTPLAVTSVAIDQEAQTIVFGNELPLTYTTTEAGSYSRDVAWESSDQTVGTVDANGVFHAVYQAGQGDPASKSTTVTLTLGKGESAKTASVVLTVFGQEAPVTSASLDATATLYIGNEPLQLTPTTVPAAGQYSDKPVWSSDHPEFATVDQTGKVTPVAAGVANITVRYNATQSATCAVTVARNPWWNTESTLTSIGSIVLPDSGNTAEKYNVIVKITEITSTTYGNGWGEAEDGTKLEIYGMYDFTHTLRYDAMLAADKPVVGDIVVLNGVFTKHNDGPEIKNADVIQRNGVVCTRPDVESIALNKSEETLEVGGSVTLTVNPTPVTAEVGTVVWESSKPGVATVENGVVTAVAAGETTITATIQGTEKTAECAITVSATVAPAVALPAGGLVINSAVLGTNDADHDTYAENNDRDVTIGDFTLTLAPSEAGSVTRPGTPYRAGQGLVETNDCIQFKAGNLVGFVVKTKIESASTLTLTMFATYNSESKDNFPIIKIGGSETGIVPNETEGGTKSVSGTATGIKSGKYEVYSYTLTYDISAIDGETLTFVTAKTGAQYVGEIVIHPAA